MKPWILLVVAVLVPGGSLIALGVYLRRRWMAREGAQLEAKLAGHSYALEAKRAGQRLDESLQAKARARREIADSIRHRSAMVASGSSSASVLKIARKA